jgi:hypothetical protein
VDEGKSARRPLLTMTTTNQRLLTLCASALLAILRLGGALYSHSAPVYPYLN